MNKYILIIVIILALLVSAVAAYVFLGKGTKDEYIAPVDTKTTISFAKAVSLDCPNENTNTGHPVAGGASIDIDNDGKKEIFITTGDGKKDCLIQYQNGEFVNIIDKSGIESIDESFGVFSVDFTENGFVDLFVARESGVFLYENKNGHFKETLIYDNFPNKSVPFSVALSDFDRDGDLDIYVPTFIAKEHFTVTTFNDRKHAQENVFLENLGNLKFKNITEEAGLSYTQNTFDATFVDLNNDGFEDLILVLNTDQTKVYKNNGDRTFSAPKTLGDYGFWMGLAVSDIDSDGDLDLFFSNTGDTIKSFLLRGDLRDEQILDTKYTLWENDGDFNFKNIIGEISSNNLEFGWGIIPFDINLDNTDDFIVRQNYVGWAPHRIKRNGGGLLINDNEELKEAIGTSGLSLEVYGFSALIDDFDNDGKKDVVYLNLKSPHTFHKNKTHTTKEKFSIELPPTKDYINTKVKLYFKDKTSITKNHIRKQGIQTTHGQTVSFYTDGQKKPDFFEVHSSKQETQTIEINRNKKTYDF